MKNHFVKSHGLGNDYVVMDATVLDFTLDGDSIEVLCNRNYGIGSDGILLLVHSNKADFGLRILNPDGSEAEKSGNGLRIFAKYLYEKGYVKKKVFSIDTLGGLVTAKVEIEGQRVRAVTVDMGKATFNPREIPVESENQEAVAEKLSLGQREIRFTAVSVGNPHCVVFVDELDEELIRELGPKIENHPVFPNRTNVQFARVVSNSEASVLIWERGAGYTLASGSSSCAVAAACVRLGLTQKRVQITMPGGNLDIMVGEDWSITMRGEVEEVFTGVLSPDILHKLRRLSTMQT